MGANNLLTKSAWASETSTWNNWEHTELYTRWHRRVATGYANDFLIVITPSSRTGVSGTGKTTLATSFAKAFDISESGFDAETQATLDAGDLAYDILPEVEEGSAIIFDEAQGAPGTDSVNARRGMKSESMDAISGILANRDNRNTIIIVAQQLGMLDGNLYPMIDAWVLIRKEPDKPDGPLATHHKLHTNDYDLKNPSPKTPGVEDLTWSDLPADDADYIIMEQKKQAAKRRRSDENSSPQEPQGIPKRARDEKIKALSGAGVPQQKIADVFDLTQSTVSKIVNNQ